MINTRTMGWKIYFWIYLILTIIGVLGYGSMMGKASLGDWIAFILSFILLLGTYSFTFKKKIVNIDLWKYAFWGNIIFWVLSFSTEFLNITAFSFLKSNIQSSNTEGIIGIIISIPALYALYELGYEKSTVK